MTEDHPITCAHLALANGTVAAVGGELGVGAMRDRLVRLALRKAAK
jgi:hypothetical protein